jgi:hypothetical protein
VGYNLRPQDVVVSDHAVRRLRLRFRSTRRWSRSRCERWIAQAVIHASLVIKRTNGEYYAKADVLGQSVYLAVMPSQDGTTCLVRTALPHAFAANNLNRRRPR